MAKNKNTETPVVETPVVEFTTVSHEIAPNGVGMVHIGEIVTVAELNTTRKGKANVTKAQRDATTNMLVAHPTGWDNGFNLQVMPSLPSDCTVKVDFDIIMQERRNMLAELTKLGEAGDVTALKKASLWKRRYWKDGKQIQVRYITNTGNTRSSCFDDANLRRLDENKPLIEFVPVEMRIFKTEQERVLANVRENTIGKQGDIPIGIAGLWAAAISLYQSGWTQSQFRFGKKDEKSKDTTDLNKIFGGNGQKYFYFCEFNADFPALNLIERFLITDINDPNYLPFDTFTVAKLGDAWRDRNAGTLTAEKLTEYLRKAMTPDANKPKMTGKDAIETFKRLDNSRSRFEYEAVLNNRPEEVAAYVAGVKDVDNIVFNEFQSGNYTRIKEYVLAYDAACKSGRIRELLDIVQEFNVTAKV